MCELRIPRFNFWKYAKFDWPLIWWGWNIKLRHYFFISVLLVLLSFSLSDAGSRGPSARAPVGPPPGRAVKSTQTDPSISTINVNQPTGAQGIGTKPAQRTNKPSAPHHLIGDPPVPDSIAELHQLLDRPSSGSMRPAAPDRPSIRRPGVHRTIL